MSEKQIMVSIIEDNIDMTYYDYLYEFNKLYSNKKTINLPEVSIKQKQNDYNNNGEMYSSCLFLLFLLHFYIAAIILI
jgi:hypothetical protein